MLLTRKKSLIIILFLVSCAIALSLFSQEDSSPEIDSRLNLNLDRRIEIAVNLATKKLTKTIDYLETSSPKTILYPSYTYGTPSESNWFDRLKRMISTKRSLPSGAWLLEKPKFWSAGAFPAALWKMSAYEKNGDRQKYWQTKAKIWSEPLRNSPTIQKDIALNSLFPFQPWYENADGEEKERQLQTILAGARILAQSYQSGKGNFHEDIGAMGFERKASRTDNRLHWQVFMDHTINVEQLLWAAAHNPNLTEGTLWRKKAISHIKTIARTFGKNRQPGKSGTWQRGYFDFDRHSPTYGRFLFNEGKQGWGDGSTWSRGQAWFIYSASITYAYTRDAEILQIAKEAIDYFLQNLPDRFPGELRRQDDFIAPWDFDYALEKDPDTARDSSANAIAVSGMLKLIKTLPEGDRQRGIYLQDLEKILFNLTSSEYLPEETKSEMALLRHGCYHHFASITPSDDFDNGLIWGDYFAIDAFIEYQKLTQK